MRKDELRKLRALPATREMMKKAKYDKYRVFTRVQNLNGYIKVALFKASWMKKGINTPIYEIFINQEGGEWITRLLDENGKEEVWSESMVHNLTRINLYQYTYGWKEVPIYYSKDAVTTLSRLPVTNKNLKGIERLRHWQQAQRDEATRLKEEREQEPWDEDMALVPKLVDGFAEWMHKQGKSQYILYEYARKQEQGYCSRCCHTVPIKAPKHDKATICPRCKTKAVFKATGRIQTLTTGWHYAEVVQKIPKGIVIRRFSQCTWYRNVNYKKPNTSTREERRILIFDDGTVKKYMWGTYKNKFLRWMPECLNYWRKSGALYKKNLKALKKNSLLKYSAFDLWPRLPQSLEEYLQTEQGNPAVEKLARIGMFKLAEGLIYSGYDIHLLAQEAKELTKILKVDKSRLDRLKAINGNVTALRWMQEEKRINTRWPDDLIKDFSEENIKPIELEFIPVKIGIVQIHNYVKKQAKIMNESIAQVVITWRDYLYMAKDLKMNTKLEQIYKPKDLKIAHDELIILKNTKNIEKEAAVIVKKFPKVEEQLKKLQKFEYKKGDFEIVAPKKVVDIVKEGRILKHCVHTCDYYFSRIQTDESYLFFLRHSNHRDMPWYTLEVEPSGNIRQKRTTGDNQNADFDTAREFLNDWQKYFKKQLTKEEQELGEKANLLRKKNYEELRKNGNRIWHGKLAGQLLADVLEKDFMEAI